MNNAEYIALISLIAVLGSNLVWALSNYTNSEKKKYAAERDFEHLKKNQINISEGIAQGFNSIEEELRESKKDLNNKLDQVSKEVSEVKAWLIRNQKQ